MGTIHNSNLPNFVKESVKNWFDNLATKFAKGLLFFWYPACDTCEERSVDCLTIDKPCDIQRRQKRFRKKWMQIAFVSVWVAFIIWTLAWADNKYHRIEHYPKQQSTIKG